VTNTNSNTIRQLEGINVYFEIDRGVSITISKY